MDVQDSKQPEEQPPAEGKKPDDTHEIQIGLAYFNEWFELKLKNKYKRGLEGLKLRFNQVFSVVKSLIEK